MICLSVCASVDRHPNTAMLLSHPGNSARTLEVVRWARRIAKATGLAREPANTRVSSVAARKRSKSLPSGQLKAAVPWQVPP